ncbi:Chromatin modification-related eaf1 [Lecanosticta acicola]|uniref:Vacuolar import and degradation protein 21 n=1 Tax=Lecanosticta acicola TaxID=111012 RepID=A0AAI8YYY4_9PEZI|nr:Chromatin modification-related eaf1 [Lecanosticta acicola]
MSTLAELRVTEVQSRKNELKTLGGQHCARLRTLYHIHAAIQNNTSLSALVHTPFDSENPDSDETLFLEGNDLSRGFNTKALTLLPGPATLQQQRDNDPISTSKLPSDPALSSALPREDATPKTRAQDGAVAPLPLQTEPSQPKAGLLDSGTPAGPPVIIAEGTPGVANISDDSVKPLDSNIAPAKVAPPLPEEGAGLAGTGEQYLLDQQAPQKPADTVHLPPEEVQEEKLREREAEEQRRKQSDADSKASQRLAAPQTESASSPSSTVAYSAATPQPHHETSDTSPDSEHAPEELTPPKDLRPSLEEQRRKDEHDRQLEAQKELARQKGMGDVAVTPDDQLRLEEQEAAARDAEERAAREAVGGPEHDSKGDRYSTEAAQVAGEMEVDKRQAEEHTVDAKPSVQSVEEKAAQADQLITEENSAAISSEQSSLSAPVPTPPSAQRSQRGTPAESAGKHSTPAPSKREGMTTRVSSGAIRPRSVSEIIDNFQSPAAESSPAQKEIVSPVSFSPITQRHAQETPKNVASPQMVLSHRQSARTPPSTRTLSMSTSALEQLEVLKGAAEDPGKDYLEPLFRIQAHDLPGSGTKPLPDLLKMDRKTLSTEDHFTAMHERLDFRMLRRIYQLQNANKWSLRQMEKCKEPEQPVTHHDHMMAEMKWMRKDFKAERKMKKSICAVLARSCAEWVAADAEGRKQLQVNVKSRESKQSIGGAESVPELEQAGDSAAEDDLSPPTPREGTPLPITLVVAPELEERVRELEQAGKLSRTLKSLPQTGLLDPQLKLKRESITKVSKFIGARVLPKSSNPTLKRSRYDYEDEDEFVEAQPSTKRLREELPPEQPDYALFHSDNKPIRDRLHSNNAFRPPSEFIMPSVSFYEFRAGSQWLWEDEQKLKKLAKEYSFNWSLISDEMSLPSRYKSSSERRTPWECFERWVELESLPNDMRKTVYFKTWYQRLEQSQQAAEQRYNRQVQHIQQAQQNGVQTQLPLRRRTLPSRVERRRSARYLWMVDGFRKLAKKREQAAWKQAETARAAAQRKSQAEANPAQKMVKMTPQEFSKKRQERDLQALEYMKQQRLKQIEAQRQQLAARQNQLQQQQGMPNGMPNQQRHQVPGNPGQQAQMQANGQQVPNMNGQAAGQQQLRPVVPMAPQRNGHLAPPQVNAQGIPQAQMQARAAMAQHPNMQPQIAQANAQGRSPQYANQQFQMPNGNMPSPGGSNLTNQQQLQANHALLQALQHNNAHQNANGNQSSTQQQMSVSPSMPPPPTPQSTSQQLSSGHVPQIVAIKERLRAANPGMSETELSANATAQMKQMSQSQIQSQSTSQMRQSAMSAAAGIPNQQQNGMQQAQQFAQNQSSYQRNGQMVNGMNGNGVYMNGDGSTQQANISPAPNTSSPSEQQRQLYQQNMYRQQLQHKQQMQMQSPHTNHAQLNGSPNVAQASPNMTPASPSVQLANTPGQMSGGMGTPTMNGQRPPSRSNTPQMQRLGSAGSGAGGMGNGMQSPGAMQQGSPRNIQASLAR